MKNTTSFTTSATSARATLAADATVWAMYDIATFLVEAAQKEFTATGRHLRRFLWQEYFMTEAAMAAFVAAYRASSDAIAHHSSLVWNLDENNTAPFTPEEMASLLELDSMQDKAWENFALLFCAEHPDQSEGNIRDAIDREKWAVAEIRRKVEADFYSAVKVLY
jgi:hypothetical protein